MAVPIRISEMLGDDIHELQQLFLAARNETFSWLDVSRYKLSDFDEQTAGEYILVAKSGAEIAGFTAVWPPDVFIHHLYVKKKYQRLGVGRALLQEVKSRFPSTLRLKCLKRNVAAIDFYTKTGFRETGDGAAEDGEFLVFEYAPDPG